ncbi:MAG: isocitrate lyase/phosphoenolpyruvate mutase family protein [Actinomycetota bacterium]
MTSLADKAELLRELHHGSRPLLLPNAWDAASARLVETAGFEAVATSSGAVAAVLGRKDDDSMPANEAFAAITRVARNVSVPVTADLEAGYRLPAQELVARLLATGAVGCNLEDTDHHRGGGLVALDDQVERLRDIRSAAQNANVDIVINARVDVFRGDREPPAKVFSEGVGRARAYLESGADCVYPIGLADEKLIEDFVAKVQAPVNIYANPSAPPIPRLAELGVARVSFAAAMMRHAYRALETRLSEIRDEWKLLPPGDSGMRSN